MNLDTRNLPEKARELFDFADEYSQGRHSPETDHRIFLDTNHSGRIPSQLQEELQSLIDQPDLDHKDLTQLARTLNEVREHCLHTAQSHLHQLTTMRSDKQLLVFMVELALYHAGTRIILNQAASWPPNRPDTGNEDQDASCAEAAASVLAPFMIQVKDDPWRRQVKALDLADTELRHYSLTGEPPTWFLPDQMTVTAQRLKEGHSVVNPGPMPMQNADVLTAYIARRMELFLASPEPDETNPKSLEHQVRPPALGDLMVSPFVDWELAGHQGPGNRKLPTHSRIPQQLQVTTSDSPEDHASLSYRVALQEHLPDLELQHKIATGDPRALALHTMETAAVMPPMAHTCRTLPALMAEQSNKVRMALPQYSPTIRWDQAPENNLALTRQMAQSVDAVNQAAAEIQQTHAGLVLLHLEDTLRERADQSADEYHMSQEDRAHEHEYQATNATTSLFGAQLIAYHPPKGHQAKEPAVMLLTEGLTTLYEAKQTLMHLKSVLNDSGIITWEPEEKQHEQDKNASYLANVLAHADWCVIAAHMLLDATSDPLQQTPALKKA